LNISQQVIFQLIHQCQLSNYKVVSTVRYGIFMLKMRLIPPKWN